LNNSVISAFCELEKTLQRELDTQISMARIKMATITGFDSVYDIKVKQDKLSREETGIIKRLYKNKYVTEEWNARHEPDGKHSVSLDL